MRRMGFVGMVVCLMASTMVALGTTSAQASFEYLCRGKTVAEVRACDTSGYADQMHKSWWRAYSGHNCTNYAGYRMHLAGVPTPPGPMGNGEKWAASARKLGYRVDTKPAVGSIGTWENVKGINHVVYVEQVGPGWIIYSDDTYSNREFRRIKVTVGEKWYPKLFIHFKDVVEPGAPYAAPTSVAARTTGANSMTVSWKAVAGAPRHRIEYATKPDFSDAKQVDAAGSATSIAIKGLQPLTTYYVRAAVAESATGELLGAWSTTPHPSTTTVAPTPTGLTTSKISASSMDVSWNAVAGAPHYRVQYSTKADRSDAKYANVAAPATSLSLTGLKAGTTYTVRVAAVEKNNGPTIGSYTGTPYPTARTTAVASAAPALVTPTGLTMSSVTSTSMNVSWNAVPGAPHYRVQYSTKANRSDAKYANVAAPGTSLALTGLKASTTYYVRVSAVQPNNGPTLTPYTATPYPTAKTAAVAKAPALVTPTGLKMSSVSSTSMNVSWNAVAGAPHYRVQYSTKANRSDAKYANVAAPGTSLTLKGLKPSTTYYVRVSTVQPNNGPTLTPYTATPYPTAKTAAVAKAATYTTPTGLKTSKITASSMDVSWNAVAGAPHYRVQYSTKANRSDAKYANIAAPGTSLTLKGLKPSTTYYVRVSTVQPNNGPTLTPYTPTPYPTAKTAAVAKAATYTTPTGLTMSSITASSMKVSWKAVPGAPHYRVQYSTKANRSDAKYANVVAPGTSLTLKGLKKKTKYFVRVAVVQKNNGPTLTSYTPTPYPTGQTK